MTEEELTDLVNQTMLDIKIDVVVRALEGLCDDIADDGPHDTLAEFLEKASDHVLTKLYDRMHAETKAAYYRLGAQH